MSGIFDVLFKLLFGSRGATTAPPRSPPPPPRVSPPPAPPPPPPATPIQTAPPVAPLPPAQMSPLPPPPPLTPPASPPVYIDSLRAQSRDPISRADFEGVAQRFNCEWEAVAAVAKVESGTVGAFGPDGRPVILFEPHIFSRLTNHQYDESNPTISYKTFGTRPYPRTQEERWNQLKEAYALNPEAALKSASYGKFQILGQNHSVCGFATASEFVADMSKSEARQLAAFEAFVRTNNLVPALQAKDWAAFARGYNGPAYQQTHYDTKMADAYNQLKSGGTI
ncbi:MAG TPA: N-acetylmuramidase family protein [Caulobacterales bacterium]|nr:N-acetylmuramidase family protein [Caulobacterales bacterium]